MHHGTLLQVSVTKYLGSISYDDLDFVCPPRLPLISHLCVLCVCVHAGDSPVT